jgi:hypothetical protein
VDSRQQCDVDHDHRRCERKRPCYLFSGALWGSAEKAERGDDDCRNDVLCPANEVDTVAGAI